MRDLKIEVQERVGFIRSLLESSGAKGVVFGNSGGKDSALVGILCRMACDNVLGVVMPCHAKRNFGEDLTHARLLADRFDIQTMVVDLTPTRDTLLGSLEQQLHLPSVAAGNLAPRLRMVTLYAVAQTRGSLVAGTSNASERYMGYFTKWGDGACDFNPIADLGVAEIFELLRYVKAPEEIVCKAPSAGLFDGQTDEGDMGVSYDVIDRHRAGEAVSPEERTIIERMHKNSQHKRAPIQVFRPEEL